MGGSGGGGNSAQKKRKQRQSAADEKMDAFMKAVQEDKTISDTTRSELLSQAKSDFDLTRKGRDASKESTEEFRAKYVRGGLSEEEFGSLSAAERKRITDESQSKFSNVDKGTGGVFEKFEKAKEGIDPKFKSRQTQMKQGALLKDRPGLLQSRLTR